MLSKSPPAEEPIKVEVTMLDLDALGRAHEELDRARSLVALAVECDSVRDREQQQTLLAAGASKLAAAVVDLGRVLRLLGLRRQAIRNLRGRIKLHRRYSF